MAQNKEWDLTFAFCIDRAGHDWLDDGCAKCGVGRRYFWKTQCRQLGHDTYEADGVADRVTGLAEVWSVCERCGEAWETGKAFYAAPRMSL